MPEDGDEAAGSAEALLSVADVPAYFLMAACLKAAGDAVAAGDPRLAGQMVATGMQGLERLGARGAASLGQVAAHLLEESRRGFVRLDASGVEVLGAASGSAPPRPPRP